MKHVTLQSVSWLTAECVLYILYENRHTQANMAFENARMKLIMGQFGEKRRKDPFYNMK